MQTEQQTQNAELSILAGENLTPKNPLENENENPFTLGFTVQTAVYLWELRLCSLLGPTRSSRARRDYKLTSLGAGITNNDEHERGER